MDFIVGILGAGIGSGTMAILLAYLNRKWNKADKQDEKMDAVVDGLKVLTVDRVRYLGKSYISSHGISLEDKENLQEMYRAYKKLGGNGHLNTVMDEVERLPIICVLMLPSS